MMIYFEPWVERWAGLRWERKSIKDGCRAYIFYASEVYDLEKKEYRVVIANDDGRDIYVDIFDSLEEAKQKCDEYLLNNLKCKLLEDKHLNII